MEKCEYDRAKVTYVFMPWTHQCILPHQSDKLFPRPSRCESPADSFSTLVNNLPVFSVNGTF